MAKLIKILGCGNRQQTADVIFIHGLGGDGLATWHTDPQAIQTQQRQQGTAFDPGQLDFWPRWLGQALDNVCIWSLDYAVEPSDWKKNTLPLAEQANHVLEVFANNRIGQRPLVLITYSMGGLLAKQLLRNALDFGTARQRQVAEHTKGIVFLATPHSGSNWSNWAQFINGLLLKLPKLSLSVEELEYGHSRLQALNQVFRGHPQLGQIPVKAYYETQPYKGLGVVVDKVSADLGKPEPTVPVDADHISICKISRQQKEEGVVYGSVLLFLEDCLEDCLSLNAPVPPIAPATSGLTMDRSQLFENLAGIRPALFAEVVFTLNPPAGIVPSDTAAQGMRVAALLNWAEGPGGCGLPTIKAVLDQILNRPR